MHIKGGLNRIFKYLFISALLCVIGYLIYLESQHSYLQSKVFSSISSKLSVSYVSGVDQKEFKENINSNVYPESGPYDKRFGYNNIPIFVERLKGHGFGVKKLSKLDSIHASWVRRGIFPQYHEKDQGGLTVFDVDGNKRVNSKYPKYIFKSYLEVPPIVSNILLFIEDRHLLRSDLMNRNPAVEWDRFGIAVYELLLSKVGLKKDVQGGSTLATQLEKFRHSEKGITQGAFEKFRQMLSATLRAYRNGENSISARQGILLSYINSVPLAALRGIGEVNGLGDGLKAYFNISLDRVKSLLNKDFKGLNDSDKLEYAGIVRSVLSLFLAHRKPTKYLKNSKLLNNQVKRYVPLLINEKIISKELGEIILSIKLSPLQGKSKVKKTELDKGLTINKGSPTISDKGSLNIRTKILTILGMSSLYDLDRLDLNVRSTVNWDVQTEIFKHLKSLKNKSTVKSLGLIGRGMLLPNEDPKDIILSLNIYEKTPTGNLLRVQADNYDNPLNINEGVKIDLGSTSKLRTLISYLEIISECYDLISPKDRKEKVGLIRNAGDKLTKWVGSFLLRSPSASRSDVLTAAMLRQYSASPYEKFFTAGGLHTFHNFSSRFNTSRVSVGHALRYSINLPFIRMMRDIIQYLSDKKFGASGSYTSLKKMPKDVREQFLRRFADKEGKTFMWGFYKKYRDLSKEEIIDTLLKNTRRVNSRSAAFIWELIKDKSLEEFTKKTSKVFADNPTSISSITGLHETLKRYEASLADRAYLARLHPLELWLSSYLYKNKDAKFSEVVKNSDKERQDAYRWLIDSKATSAQNQRIRIILEVEAFQELHRRWERLGYQMSSLVPSLATSLGVSADTPDALAKLIGIIQNNGLRYPYKRFTKFSFAENTPYAVSLQPIEPTPVQVLNEDITKVVRQAIHDVVQSGTARRLRDGLSGKSMGFQVGGKTGTGDHRHKVFRYGRLISEVVMNRSATFVFIIGDRFFGTITAFVPGKKASKYKFTSALVVQILKSMEKKLAPLLESASPNINQQR